MSSSPTPLWRLVLVLAVTLSVGSGCGGDDDVPPGTIDRDTFVQVMVDLRMAALKRRNATPTPADRARILEDHGVTEEDLVAFAEVRGHDPGFMVEVWREIEQRLNVPIDSAGGEAEP